jgi:monofunctional biosynthetic peptidoglycan transglycosylase
MGTDAIPVPLGGPPQDPSAEAGAVPRPRRRTLRRRIGVALLKFAAAYYIVAVVLLAAARFVNPPITAVQLERRIGALVARQPYQVEQRFVPLASLPLVAWQAVVAAEDGRFWTHFGFDIAEMRDAGADLLDGEGLRGASTITQQLVKNLFACTCRNPLRKIVDWSLTPPAELILGKRRILELYLNNVEWGDGVFGIEAAARHHYGVPAMRLTRTQAAGLAALLPNPLTRTSRNTPQYRAEILRRMSVRGW